MADMNTMSDNFVTGDNMYLRELQNFFFEVLGMMSITHYGCIGDGRTDNYPYLQVAIDDANRRGLRFIYVPYGIYRYRGELQNIGALKFVGNPKAKIVNDSTGEEITIEQYGVDLNGALTLSEDLIFKDGEASTLASGFYYTGEHEVTWKSADESQTNVILGNYTIFYYDSTSATLVTPAFQYFYAKDTESWMLDMNSYNADHIIDSNFVIPTSRAVYNELKDRPKLFKLTADLTLADATDPSTLDMETGWYYTDLFHVYLRSSSNILVDADGMFYYNKGAKVITTPLDIVYYASNAWVSAKPAPAQRNAITAVLGSDYSMPSSNGTIPLELYNKVGNGFTINNSGKIVVGQGISYVKIQAQVLVSTSVEETKQIMVYSSPKTRVTIDKKVTTTEHALIVCAEFIQSVSNGDTINLGYWGSTGDSIKGKSNYLINTYLTVEAIG